MKLRDFTHLKPITRHGTTRLYGATNPDGPWFRLTKRETAFITRHADTILPKPETDDARTTDSRGLGRIARSRD